mmetsp:Transcript_89872/g.155602  ORF Transcript_89872/g.155602 Transcript_89872/m.155602 type:complete len:776 (-) Transcript_89872:90-2417(-)
MAAPLSDMYSLMESPGGMQRLRLVPRNEVLVSERDQTQSLVAERDRLVRQLEELEKQVKESRTRDFNLKRQIDRERRQAYACKENYLQEAERWQKKYEHHHGEELRTRTVLQELFNPGLAKRLSDTKAWSQALEAKAEIQRAQQDVKQLAAGVPDGSAEDERRSLQEIQDEIQKMHSWLEANPADAPATGKASAPAAGKGASTDINGSRSPETVASPTAAPKGGKGPPPPKAPGNAAPTAAPVGGKGPPPPKAPGKGKGKGPTGGPPPKAPAAKASPPGSGKGGGAAEAMKKTPTRQSKLVSLNWTLKSTRTPSQAQDNDFNSKLSELVTSFGCSFRPRAAVAAPPRVAQADTDSSAPPVQETVFDSIEVKEMPEVCLERLFKVKDIPKKKEKEVQKSGEKSILDSKVVMIIEMIIKRRQLHHKGESKKQAVASIKQGILQCNVQIVPQDLMALCKIVLDKHKEGGNPVSKYVQANGEAALDRLQNHHEHRFVYEILKCPQIEVRLDNMLWVTEFPNFIAKLLPKVEQACDGLAVLKQKRPAFQKFFTMAHRLGQGLNRDCKATQAPNGFMLSSIEKFVSTKTTKSKNHHLLHVVIALMHPDDVAGVAFSAAEMRTLREAKDSKIGFVHKEVEEILDSFHSVQSICQDNTYTGKGGVKIKMETKRKTMAPSSEEARIDDPDDKFRDAMEDFVNAHRHQVQQLARSCFEMMKSYEDLAMFFDDLTTVYPPPKSDNDPKKDLIAEMYSLAGQIAAFSKEVQKDGLRQQLYADFGDCA